MYVLFVDFPVLPRVFPDSAPFEISWPFSHQHDFPNLGYPCASHQASEREAFAGRYACAMLCVVVVVVVVVSVQRCKQRTRARESVCVVVPFLAKCNGRLGSDLILSC